MITITIDTDNAAFDNNPEGEAGRILRQLGNQFLSNIVYDDMPIKDLNGNTVGHVAIEETPQCDIVELEESTAGKIYQDDRPYYCYTHNTSTNNSKQCEEA